MKYGISNVADFLKIYIITVFCWDLKNYNFVDPPPPKQPQNKIIWYMFIVHVLHFQTNLLNEHGATVAQISATTQQKYGHLQKQHQDFIAHLNNQLQQLQQQLQILQQQVVPQGPPPPQGMASMVEGLPPGGVTYLTSGSWNLL